MGRKRQFDLTHVLDAALLCFWRAGFEACGLQELQDATGLSRASLYNAFENKKGMFEAVLRHYDERVSEALEPLNQPDAGLTDIRDYLQTTLVTFHQLGSGGCLVVTTALSPIGADPDVQRILSSAGRRVRDAFADVVRRCQARGELVHLHPADVGDQIYALLHGLAALHATGGSSSTRALLDSSFAQLESP